MVVLGISFCYLQIREWNSGPAILGMLELQIERGSNGGLEVGETVIRDVQAVMHLCGSYFRESLRFKIREQVCH